MTTTQMTVIMGLLLVMGFFNVMHQRKIRKKKEAIMKEERKKLLGDL